MNEGKRKSIFIHFGFIGEVPFFGVFGNERGNSTNITTITTTSKNSERGF